MLLQGERDLAVSLHVGHETRQKKKSFLLARLQKFVKEEVTIIAENVCCALLQKM